MAQDLGSRSLSQLIQMYINGTISIDELTAEIGRRSQSGDLLTLQNRGLRSKEIWNRIDPFGEIQVAVDSGKLERTKFEALTNAIGEPPSNEELF